MTPGIQAWINRQQGPVYAFTTLGIVALIGVAVLLAANDKTGPAIVLMIAVLILLVILVNYTQVLSLFFKKEGA